MLCMLQVSLCWGLQEYCHCIPCRLWKATKSNRVRGLCLVSGCCNDESPINRYWCGDVTSQCTATSNICDGIVQCMNGDDEKHCWSSEFMNASCYTMFCVGDMKSCIVRTWQVWEWRCMICFIVIYSVIIYVIFFVIPLYVFSTFFTIVKQIHSSLYQCRGSLSNEIITTKQRYWSSLLWYLITHVNNIIFRSLP